MVSNIRILDVVTTASTYEDGEAVCRKLLEQIDAGHPVFVSFDGIHAVPSAFVNAAFLKLLETHSFEEIQKLLKIRDSTRNINELVRSRFEFANAHRAR